MPYGMMKTAFPFELQQDIAALAKIMNGLRLITILGAQSQIWGFPPFYDLWANMIRHQFTTAKAP